MTLIILLLLGSAFFTCLLLFLLLIQFSSLQKTQARARSRADVQNIKRQIEELE